MAGKGSDDDRGGFPEDIFEQMKKGHEKFMRDLQDTGRRFQQDVEDETKRGSFFLSFKDFVDSNLSSLKESFRSFPNNIAELRAKMQEEREQRKQEELEIWRRWTGIEESPDHCQMLSDRASPETRKVAVDTALVLLREARNRNADVAPEKIVALYKDTTPFGGLDRFAEPMLSPGGACYYQRDSGYNAPSTTFWRFGTPNHRWLSIDWFKRSQYSPVTLEDKAGMMVTGVEWRSAFEDLLNATLDKPMNSLPQVGTRIPHGKPQSTHYGPGLDWMLSLQCRGILPPQLPRLYNSVSSWRQLPELTDEALKRHATASFGVSDMSQLIEEIATPVPAQGYQEGETFTEMDVAYQQKPLEYYQEQLKMLQEANDRGLVWDPAGAERANYPDPPLTTAQQSEPWVPALTGNKADDLVDVAAALTEALDYGDLQAAMQCLNDWHDTYGDFEALVEPLGDYRAGIWEYVERLEQERDALQLKSKTQTSSAPIITEPPQRDAGRSGTDKVDVLSSLTTTQTTRLPDGTTTTKVILKQRFADGREETHEKVHTYQEPPNTTREAVDEPKDESSKQKKGWFWS